MAYINRSVLQTDGAINACQESNSKAYLFHAGITDKNKLFISYDKMDNNTSDA